MYLAKPFKFNVKKEITVQEGTTASIPVFRDSDPQFNQSDYAEVFFKIAERTAKVDMGWRQPESNPDFILKFEGRSDSYDYNWYVDNALYRGGVFIPIRENQSWGDIKIAPIDNHGRVFI